MGVSTINKSDVITKYHHFCAFVKNQFRQDIKSFQYDNGGEFDNQEFHKLFDQNGITFFFSCPHTSQQNGMSECMIRTINNLMHTLLFQAHIPPMYWVETIHMVTHLWIDLTT